MEILTPGLIDTLLVLGGGTIVANKDKILKYIKTLAEDHNSLESHDLFNIINDKQVNTLKYIKFQNSLNKTKMIREFLGIKLQVIENKTLEFVRDKKKTKLKGQELYTACINLFLEIVEEHDKQWLETFKSKGVEEETIEYIISVFNRWHKDTIQSIQSRLNSIFKSGFHKTSYQKIVAMLEVFAFSIDLLCKEGVKSFEEMNGTLDSIEYD